MNTPHRIVPTLYDKDGRPYCQSITSPAENTVRAKCLLPPDKVLPVLFIPGIMGSNLRRQADGSSDSVTAWFPDSLKWAWSFKSALPADREQILDPARTYAADLSDIPEDNGTFFKSAPKSAQDNWRAEFKRRGWGTVTLSSYGPVLHYLESRLNRIYQQGEVNPDWRNLLAGQGRTWGQMEGYQTLTEGDLFKAADYWYPVHAVGYNWLRSNADAGRYLARQIDRIIGHYGKLGYDCKQVVLVTHSMGGLVARAAAHPKIGNAQDRILGIVHGEQPATGAATAYKRIRAGFEASLNPVDIITAKTLGWSAAEVTAVFANAPGALELLPNKLYPKGWLRIASARNTPSSQDVMALPRDDPYEEIYRVKDKWWRLVDPTLIDPAAAFGDNEERAWKSYENQLYIASSFHETLLHYYHAATWAHYGADPEHKTWGRVRWVPTASSRLVPNQTLPDAALRNDDRQGMVVLEPPGSKQRANAYVPWWNEIIGRPAEDGDGTVPEASGGAPSGRVRFLARMKGFDHQNSYKHPAVLDLTLYCVAKIAQNMP